MSINIYYFSTEVLLYIFQYCDIYDLCRLRQCCKRFNKIICDNKIQLHEYNALVTNQIKHSIRNRSKILLEPYEKWRISHNWKIGRYKTATVLKQRRNFMPWLFLDDKFLWLSQGKYIRAYKRTHTLDEKEPYYILNNDTNNDIVRFTFKENMIISGQRTGGLWIWSLNERRIILNLPACHSSDTTSVDLTRDIFVTGSYDKSFKIWPLNTYVDIANLQPLLVHNINDRIWSLSISPHKKYLALGSAGFNHVPPFHVFDLERHQSMLYLGSNFIRGSGILDVHWENDNIVLTCGYDTFLRKWDLRTGRCEQKWEDPHDSALYCLSSDDLYTVICGTNVYGRTILWDQRTKNYIQMYYTCSNSDVNKSSPVYSLSFDGSQLFTALDRCVKCLDFSSQRGQIKNYSDLYLNFSNIHI